MAEFCMPSLGADMDRGTLLEWKVAPGDRVAKGDIVAVIDTEKSDIDVEIFHSGTIRELLVDEGTEVEVGAPLARFDQDDGAATAPAPEPEPRHPPVHSPIVRHLAVERSIDLDTVHGTGPGGAITRADLEALVGEAVAGPPATLPATDSNRLRSSPRARRRAEELGVDLATVTGTGPDGAITAPDVEAIGGDRSGESVPTMPVASPPVAAPTTDRSASVRQATGRLMARSKREIPHYYLSATIDLHGTLDWLEQSNRDRPVTKRVLPAAMLLTAVVRALRSQPRLNGWWVDDELRLATSVDLGVGVALRSGGLIAPVISGAERLGLDDMMDALREIVGRARAGRLKGTDLGEASITVTNLGDQGADSVYGVIAPPQVAVVGFGTIAERPWAIDHMLTVRPLVTATLAADHRATDGHEGARFLAELDHLLHDPQALTRPEAP